MEQARDRGYLHVLAMYDDSGRQDGSRKRLSWPGATDTHQICSKRPISSKSRKSETAEILKLRLQVSHVFWSSVMVEIDQEWS